MSRPRVLLLCGGKSGEHEVSLASARSVLRAAGGRCNITPLVIDKRGRVLPGDLSMRLICNGEGPATNSPDSPNALTSKEQAGAPLHTLPEHAFDVVFPLLHGPLGEDGSVQGMLKLMNLPFVGSDVLGSAVSMDKGVMKAVLAARGLPQTAYCLVKRSDWQTAPENVLEGLEPLPYPLFVKPANLGSSVGISRVEGELSLRAALDEAARFDRRILVEAGVVGARELEVGVLGNDRPRVSPVGEVCSTADFYDYHAKYTEGQTSLQIPARVPDHITAECQELALEVFDAVDAAGLARVDFFYVEAEDRVLVNEINTMPGFTTTSMYPKLWEAAGLSYPELVETLLELALEGR